jgi:branched-chain amino acid transport system permease protein
MLIQLLVNGVVASALNLPAALGMLLVYRTQRFIFFAFAAVVTVGPYVAWQLLQRDALPFSLGVIVGLGASALAGITAELLLHGPARRKGAGSLGLLLLSIGCYAAAQNTLTLCFGNDLRSFRTFISYSSVPILSASVTNVQLVVIVAALVCTAGLWAVYRLTAFGLHIRAVANDPCLSAVHGVRVEAVFMFTTVLGCLLGGVAGIANACDSDITPTMGMMPLMMGVVAVMVGQNTLWGTVGGTFLLGMGRNLGVIWIGTQWQDAMVFVILLAFLLVRGRGKGIRA